MYCRAADAWCPNVDNLLVVHTPLNSINPVQLLHSIHENDPFHRYSVVVTVGAGARSMAADQHCSLPATIR